MSSQGLNLIHFVNVSDLFHDLPTVKLALFASILGWNMLVAPSPARRLFLRGFQAEALQLAFHRIDGHGDGNMDFASKEPPKEMMN